MVYIEDIADEMEEVDEEHSVYLNKITEEFTNIPDEYLDWEKDIIEEAITILDNYEDFVRLPSQYDIKEYSIMRDFADEINNNSKQEKLYKAISGKGAFRRFKKIVYDLDLEKLWFEYKFQAYCKIAKEWCEENGIEAVYKKATSHKI